MRALLLLALPKFAKPSSSCYSFSVLTCCTPKTLNLNIPAPTHRQIPAGMVSSLSEPDVGISCFVSSLPGFRGILKHRYVDFIVNEVNREGKIVRLTSFDLPPECGDSKEEEKVPSSEKDYSAELELFRALCADVDFEALKGLVERISSGAENEVSPIVLSADADKSHRAEVHNFFKKNFKFLVTDTVECSDGVQKCIRVRLNAGATGGRGGRGKKRKHTRNSDPRDHSPFDSRGSENWQENQGKFLRFHLYKENKDTQDALGIIGKMLGVQLRSFGFAGTKDKRSVSTQQVTVFKIQANRLASLNRRLFGIQVGDFCYVREGLVLGQLSGNRFTITLRGVVAESEDIIKAAADGLGKNGFINYYGLQRFGSGSIPTHLVGAALLKGEWKGAVSLILDPREGERDDIKEAREHYKEHGDVDMILSQLPRNLVAERAILQCLKKRPGNYLQALKAIPRTLRMMYVHSYQSYLWNHAASVRVQKYGILQVVQGDLVYDKDNSPAEAVMIASSEVEDECIDSSAPHTSFETVPEEKIHSVKVIDSGDLLRGTYTFEDVVLPLPGSRALFPGNEVAEIYHSMAKKDGISLTESFHGDKEFSITSVTGGYRRVFQRPIDFEWELMTYVDDNMPLAETDLDVLRKTKPLDANEIGFSNHASTSESNDDKLESLFNSCAQANGDEAVETNNSDLSSQKLALKLGFTLPASCYATMAIRELLKTSTSVAYHKIINNGTV